MNIFWIILGFALVCVGIFIVLISMAGEDPFEKAEEELWRQELEREKKQNKD